MPCEDCQRAIAAIGKLQEEIDLLRAMVEQRQDDLFDKMEQTIHKLKAEHQTMLADAGRYVRETFARLETIMRLIPEKEEPPRWQ